MEIELTDLAGKVLSRNTISPMAGMNEKIDLSHFAAGIYLVKLSDDTGIIVQKLVVQN